MGKKKFCIVLFNRFETLDAFGPVEILGNLTEEYELAYASKDGGIVASSQGVPVETVSFAEAAGSGAVLIPGGMGTRALSDDAGYMDGLNRLVEPAEFVLTVCTGSALLAKTGLLDGKKATSNKMAFKWVMKQAEAVDWQGSARWVVDGRFYTASGVSAGMDMTLGFVADQYGQERAEVIARRMEYIWNQDKDNDPFAVE
jgi:putative intracellular protease/amidase